MLAGLIDERPDFDPEAWRAELPPMDLYPFFHSQQLLLHPHPPIHFLPSPQLLTTREVGLSWRKIGTLRDLAERLTDGRLNADELSAMPDDELMAELTVIPGIGPWTVQGALLVALEREDVVLPGDLALRKAVQAAYRLDHRPSEQEVLDIAEKWRPYRSLATSYLFSAVFEQAEAAPVKAPTAARPDSGERAGVVGREPTE